MKCFIFYYGSKNIEEYFDMGSIIKIDIKNPKRSIEIIKDTISKDLYKDRLSSIENNYNKAMNLSIKNYVIDLIEKNNIKTNNNSQMFVNNFKKIRCNKIPYNAFMYSVSYYKIIYKIIKLIRMKIDKNYRNNQLSTYNTIEQ
ncbi:MAG: hypothetical protein QM532_03800 [Cyanobium sp. MAG06]|nr:hypothetical protein [Cyanobium sp. MAG06]